MEYDLSWDLMLGDDAPPIEKRGGGGGGSKGAVKGEGWDDVCFLEGEPAIVGNGFLSSGNRWEGPSLENPRLGVGPNDKVGWG